MALIEVWTSPIFHYDGIFTHRRRFERGEPPVAFDLDMAVLPPTDDPWSADYLQRWNARFWFGEPPPWSRQT